MAALPSQRLKHRRDRGRPDPILSFINYSVGIVVITVSYLLYHAELSYSSGVAFVIFPTFFVTFALNIFRTDYRTPVYWLTVVVAVLGMVLCSITFLYTLHQIYIGDAHNLCEYNLDSLHCVSYWHRQSIRNNFLLLFVEVVPIIAVAAFFGLLQINNAKTKPVVDESPSDN